MELIDIIKGLEEYDSATVQNALMTIESYDNEQIDYSSPELKSTLQVLDGEGHLVWTSKTYWSNASVLEDAATLMRSLNEASA